MAPIVDYRSGSCHEQCRVCTQVCPRGALERLSLALKQKRPMGQPRVDRSRCVAWKSRLYCLVCKDVCPYQASPYQAIQDVEHGAVMCPEIKPGVCPGCEACQAACPARPERAIRVQGLRE